jgi:hypothetical protein
MAVDGDPRLGPGGWIMRRESAVSWVSHVMDSSLSGLGDREEASMLCRARGRGAGRQEGG